MGLASFNRSRRERAGVLKIEADRFEKDNKARWDAHNAHDHQPREDYDKETAKVWKEEVAANKRIGDKNQAFIDNPEKGDPLKADHAAVMTGENVKGAQDDRTIKERLAERIPESGTAAEKLAPTTMVEGPVADPALIDKAREEMFGDKDGGVAKAAKAADESTAAEDEADTDQAADPNASNTEQLVQKTVPDREVKIADNWYLLPASGRRKIATDLGYEVKNAVEADTAIRQELAKRKPATETPEEK